MVAEAVDMAEEAVTVTSVNYNSPLTTIKIPG